jgi:hypothetical protein
LIFLFILQAEELSIIVVPIFLNLGAHSFEIDAPAENRAIFGFSLTDSSKETILISLFLYFINFPKDLSEATGISSDIGNSRSLKL